MGIFRVAKPKTFELMYDGIESIYEPGDMFSVDARKTDFILSKHRRWGIIPIYHDSKDDDVFDEGLNNWVERIEEDEIRVKEGDASQSGDGIEWANAHKIRKTKAQEANFIMMNKIKGLKTKGKSGRELFELVIGHKLKEKEADKTEAAQFTDKTIAEEVKEIVTAGVNIE